MWAAQQGQGARADLVCDPRKNVTWKMQRYGVVRPRPVHW
jgi:hypothetical protein